MIWGWFGIGRDKLIALHNKLIGICGYGEKIMTSQLKTGQLGGNKFIVMWEEVAKIALQNKTPSYS